MKMYLWSYPYNSIIIWMPLLAFIIAIFCIIFEILKIQNCIYYNFYLCKDTVIMCIGNCRHVPGNKVPLVKKVIHDSELFQIVSLYYISNN